MRTIQASAYLRAFRRYPRFVLATLLLTALFCAVNTVSMVSDYERAGQSIFWGKSLFYEVTSALAILIMLPWLMTVAERWPLTRGNWLLQLPRYVAASLVFSAGHVTLMVLLRKGLLPVLFGGHYEFFSSGYDAISYEYWKDARTFVVLLAGFFVLNAQPQAWANSPAVELRSGATRVRFLAADFIFARAAANYADVITHGGELLARITLKELAEILAEQGLDVVRVHRSVLVNRAMIEQLTPLAGGDLQLKLRGGHQVRASRRYKSQLLTAEQ